MSSTGPERPLPEAVLQAVTAVRARRLQEAADLLRGVLEGHPQCAEAWFVHGQVQLLAQHPDQAAQAWIKALELAPRLAEARAALGRLYLSNARHQHAIACFQKALEDGLDRPDLVVIQGLNRLTTQVAYGDALLHQKEHEKARVVYQSALESAPGNPELLFKLGNIHLHASRFAEARECFRQGLQAAPNNLSLRTAEISLLYLERKYDEAMERLRPLLDAAPDNPGVALNYARLCHRSGERDLAIQRLESVLEKSLANDEERITVCFELGRLYDAGGDHDRAFAHFRHANELKRRDYDRAGADASVSLIIEGYSRKNLASSLRARNRDERPVFIVGMPRSGTSLVEQILACHPAICAAGELPDMAYLVRDFRRQRNRSVAEQILAGGLDVDTLDQMAARYLARISGLCAGERYVTDKMPSNFFRLGLISLLFPGARIIHCRRDARDTCLSCYTNDFTGVHPYANDFESLAAYYRNYRRLMAHWKTVIDLPMLEVDYESLVRDQEAETRRMLAFLDLPWDERCLRFYDHRRATVTASYDQVTRPMYDSSIGRWRHYERHIAPLLKRLDAIPDDGQAPPS